MSDSSPSVDLNFANAIQDPWSGGINIYLADRQPTSIVIVTAFVCHRYESPTEEALMARPGSIKLTKEAAKRLMDALWNCGVRPTAQDTTEGHVKALQSHLEDMRHLAFLTITGEKA